MEPKDRNGNKLEIGDKVWLLNAYDGLRLYQDVVTDFEPSPGYDRSIVGIITESQTGSIHPNCVEKVEVA